MICDEVNSERKTIEADEHGNKGQQWITFNLEG